MKKIILLFAPFLFAKELIFYCGITMSKPMREIADIFEKKYHTKVIIIPGGSKSLLERIKQLKKADLYLPGSESYIFKNRELFTKYVYVGYNQLALIVKKGNPKNITIKNFKNYKYVLCNPELSSCGKETKKFLKNKFLKTYFGACEIVLDSKPLNNRIKDYADAGFNWKATALWPENRKYLDIIPINSKKKKLYIAIVKYSKNQDLAEKFLKLTQTKKAKEIMRKYGFLDEK